MLLRSYVGSERVRRSHSHQYHQLPARHRATAAILGVILKLPPLKQVMASQQMKTRYLDHLMSSRKSKRAEA
jgi:hypothetical protein